MDKKEIEKIVLETILKKENDITTKDIESTLYMYNNYKKIIDVFKNKIEILKTQDVKLYNSRTENLAVQQTKIFRDELEKKEDIIKEYENKISNYAKIIRIIDDILETLKDEKNIEIIKYIYFDNMQREDITNILKISEKTITRTKNKYLKIIKTMIKKI